MQEYEMTQGSLENKIYFETELDRFTKYHNPANIYIYSTFNPFY